MTPSVTSPSQFLPPLNLSFWRVSAGMYLWDVGIEPPPTLIDLSLVDTPKVLNRVEVRAEFQYFYVHNSQWGIRSSVRWYMVMEMTLLWKAQFFFLDHGRKWSVRNSTFFAEVTFTPSGTLKELPALSPWFWSKTWLLHLLADVTALLGQWWPSTSHPLLHPSGPSGVALHSSVNETDCKRVFMYVWAHCSHFCLWAPVTGGPNLRFMHNCKPLEDPTPWGVWYSRGTSSFKHLVPAL